MSLRDYARKRRFGETPEPADDKGSRRASSPKAPIFVVQLHHASHRHYDFRLEVDGALKSWAVPRGPSLRPGERRLAVEVEDHPLSYAGFEGIIPEGNYGAGHVQVFDHGTWSTDSEPLAAIAAGKLDFALHGSKLRGGWKLVRTRKDGSKPQWLLFKRDDQYATDVEADDLVENDAPVKPRKKASTTARSPAKRVPAMLAKGASASTGAKRIKMPSTLAPQLATSRETAPRGEGWLHEIKWDGYRLIAFLEAGRATLRTRNGLDWTGKFPGIARAIESLPVASAVLDGELCALDGKGRSDFAALQRAIKARSTDALRYLVFDLPALEGSDLSATPLLRRKELLQSLLENHPTPELAYSQHIIGHGEKVFAASKRQGVEGIISKQVDAPYVQTRSGSWVKVKHEDTDEFLVIGYTRPKGARSHFGSLLMGRMDKGRLRYAGRVGTGYDDETLREISKKLAALAQREANVDIPSHATISARDVHWVKPVLVAEVAFRGWGKEGLLRQAAFKRLREDKTPAQLTSDTPPEVRITHPERVVFKSAKITKGDVAGYYQAIAPWLLREMANRPLSLIRCPSGAEGTCFFQKHYLESLGGAVKAIKLRQKGGVEDYIYVDDAAGVLALVQMNTLEFHPWGSHIDAPESPDRMVFDLDPDPGVGWKDVVAAARDVRARLREAGLESFVRLTGGKGLHVVAPLRRGPSWEQLKHFCESFADAMVAHRPQAYVATMSKAKRTDRIFIDWLRNTRGATSVTSWSLRARPGAPVAVPLRWEDLGRIARPDAFDLHKAVQRASALRADPWQGIDELDQALPGA